MPASTKDITKKRNWERQHVRSANHDCRDCSQHPRDGEPLNYSLTKKQQARRRRCTKSLKAFLKTYFAAACPLKFSQDHERLIKLTEQVTLKGGQIVAAMPRSSGKTTIFQRAIVWATICGHSGFSVLAAADDTLAGELLAGIRTMLETNELLAEDFPEVILPIKALEGIPNRAQYQLYKGVATKIAHSNKLIKFATLKTGETQYNFGRGNHGAIIKGGGITSAMRGMVITDLEGKQRRPDVILIDDPSTRSSAGSPTRNKTRLDIMNADLGGMSGTDAKMGMLCACTVIEEDDLACRLLDNEHSPDWIPVEVPMLYSMPENMDLWEEYDNIRRQEKVFEIAEGSANKFYLANRAELDKGAKHYWPERIAKGCESAIQSAMNEYLKNPSTFASEYQNQPLPKAGSDLDPLKAMELIHRQHPWKRGECPPNTVHVTCHIDVQKKLLYYTVVAWTENLRGYVIDYGSYPEQAARNFKLTSVKTRTLQNYSPKNDDDGAIAAGIAVLVEKLAKTRYKHGDKDIGISRGLVDAKYKPEIIEVGIKQAGPSPFMPSYGFGIGAKQAPMAQWPKKPGRQIGFHWALATPAKRQLRSLLVDVNYWKSQIYNAQKVPKEHAEAITLWREQGASRHQMFCDHQCAEVCTLVDASGRKVEEWDLPSHHPDNHLWDNLANAMAAASSLGLVRKRHEHSNERKPKVKLGVRKAKAW